MHDGPCRVQSCLFKWQVCIEVGPIPSIMQNPSFHFSDIMCCDSFTQIWSPSKKQLWMIITTSAYAACYAAKPKGIELSLEGWPLCMFAKIQRHDLGVKLSGLNNDESTSMRLPCHDICASFCINVTKHMMQARWKCQFLPSWSCLVWLFGNSVDVSFSLFSLSLKNWGQ